VRLLFEQHVRAVSEPSLPNIYDDLWDGNWTTRGYASSRIANLRTGHLADWSTGGLDNSWL